MINSGVPFTKKKDRDSDKLVETTHLENRNRKSSSVSCAKAVCSTGFYYLEAYNLVYIYIYIYQHLIHQLRLVRGRQVMADFCIMKYWNSCRA